MMVLLLLALAGVNKVDQRANERMGVEKQVRAKVITWSGGPRASECGVQYMKWGREG